MSDITVSIPEEALLALRPGPDEVGPQIRLAAAVKLYQVGRLSSGAAAALARIPRTLPPSKLAHFGADTLRLRGEELEKDPEAQPKGWEPDTGDGVKANILLRQTAGLVRIAKLVSLKAKEEEG